MFTRCMLNSLLNVIHIEKPVLIDMTLKLFENDIFLPVVLQTPVESFRVKKNFYVVCGSTILIHMHRLEVQ